MKPQKQLLETDCLRACIASLLHYRIDAVPNFVDAGEELIDGFPAWWQALQSWLNELGLFFLEIKLVNNFPWQPLPIPAMCILFGTTERGMKHAIVGKVSDDRFLPVFNPHVKAGNLTSVEGIGFMIPRDPITHVRMGHALEKIKQLTDTRLIINPIITDVNALAKHALQEPDKSTSIKSKEKLNGHEEEPRS